MTDLETLAWGYGLVEGPRVDDADNLYYSDVHNGGVYRRAPDGTIDVAVPKRRGVGGIALHADGGIVVSGRNVCHVRDGESRVVFAPDAPGLNDLFVDAAGRIICGTMRSDPFDLDAPRTPGECYLVGAEGHAIELYGDVALTNGIGFSPDGSVLYHADSVRGVWAHDYDDGSVSGRRLLVTVDVVTPDGLAVDESGTVWVADVGGSSAVRGFGPDGKERGRITVPATMVTSVCFGGADRRDVYIVTADNTEDPDKGGSVFRTRADVPGVAVAKARVLSRVTTADPLPPHGHRLRIGVAVPRRNRPSQRRSAGHRDRTVGQRPAPDEHPEMPSGERQIARATGGGTTSTIALRRRRRTPSCRQRRGEVSARAPPRSATCSAMPALESESSAAP